MARINKRKRMNLLCFTLLLTFCCVLMFAHKNEQTLQAFAEGIQGAGTGLGVVVQFAQSEITVQENESFTVPVLADHWDPKSTRHIHVRIAVSDPELDIVNTKKTSGTHTLQDMSRQGVIVHALVNGSNYLTAAKERTVERDFYIRNKARSTPLAMGGYYNMDVTGDRVVTVKLLEPPDGKSYTVGPADTLTITFTEVDGRRPIRSSQGKEEWVHANLGWLQEKYPTGAYWNHFVGNSNDPDGITRVPCQNGRHREISEITPQMGIGSTICNNSSYSAYVHYEGQSYLNIDQEEFSFIQCVGYAMAVARDIFGAKPYDGYGWKTLESPAAWGTLKVGDYVRIEGHSFFVTGASPGMVTVTECNFSDDPCVIVWGAQYRISERGEAVSRISSKDMAGPSQRIESVSRMML
ncbi:MAG: hypothetical protein FWD25_09560 [Clostridia bacterium]|nr:hypothetical protein [Clostridia bacterium]